MDVAKAAIKPGTLADIDYNPPQWRSDTPIRNSTTSSGSSSSPSQDGDASSNYSTTVLVRLAPIPQGEADSPRSIDSFDSVQVRERDERLAAEEKALEEEMESRARAVEELKAQLYGVTEVRSYPERAFVYFVFKTFREAEYALRHVHKVAQGDSPLAKVFINCYYI